MRTCKICHSEMVRVLSFSSNENVKYFRCKNPKCYCETKHSRICAKDLYFETENK